jgi:hypothetical protein
VRRLKPDGPGHVGRLAASLRDGPQNRALDDLFAKVLAQEPLRLFGQKRVSPEHRLAHVGFKISLGIVDSFVITGYVAEVLDELVEYLIGWVSEHVLWRASI